MTALGIGGDSKDVDPTLQPNAFERRRPGAFTTLEEQEKYDQYLLSGRSEFNPHRDCVPVINMP